MAEQPRITASRSADHMAVVCGHTEAGAGRFEKPAPDARAAPPETHESLVSRETVAEAPLTGLSV